MTLPRIIAAASRWACPPSRGAVLLAEVEELPAMSCAGVLANTLKTITNRVIADVCLNICAGYADFDPLFLKTSSRGESRKLKTVVIFKKS